MNKRCSTIMILFLLPCALAFGSSAASAQTPTTFNYQGRLSGGGSPANGNYDFQFSLFDTVNGGGQIGPPVFRNMVVVANGVFSVSIDFGPAAFPGANRWLEISVRPAGIGGFVPLLPRQQINSAPYAIQSLNATTANTAMNATQLGGVEAARFVQQDASGNVAIGGDLTVAGALSLDTVNAQTQFNLGGQRILSVVGTGNLFAGVGAGQFNTTGFDNAFFGQGAGQQNTTGRLNSFFGTRAGFANTIGRTNAFFGWNSGASNIDGSFNAFFGTFAGNFNTSGTDNAIFGDGAGSSNTTGSGNSIFGADAGRGCDLGFKVPCVTPTTGNENSFFGRNAGRNNNASNNSFFGYLTGQVNTGANNAFFGDRAGLANTTGLRNAFFGSAAGRLNINGGNNSFFGTAAGEGNFSGSLNAFFGDSAGIFNQTGGQNSFFGVNSGLSNTSGSSNTLIGIFANVGVGNLTNATAVGANAVVSLSNSLVLGNNANVGIGTSAPQTKLTVQTATGNYGFTHTDGSGANAITLSTYVGGSSSDAVGGWLGTQSTHQLHFFTSGGQSSMTIDTTGNVGIGATAPKEKLEVTGGNILVGSPGQGIILKSPDGATCSLLSIDNDGAMVLTTIGCP